MNATYQCVPDPAASLSASARCRPDSAIDTSTFGLHTFVVTAHDADGNVVGSLQRTYIVEYPFKGFFQPVDNEPVLNVVNAGQRGPGQVQPHGNQGLEHLLRPELSEVADDRLRRLRPGRRRRDDRHGRSEQSELRSRERPVHLRLEDGLGWSNTCRALIVKTKDGLVHRADFQFK